MKCVACKILENNRPADYAFLAGIAFTFQHNNEAIRAALCERHATAIKTAAAAASVAIKPEDRRGT